MKQLPTILNRMGASPIFILSISLLLSFLYCPPFDILFDDKYIFTYIGRVIAHGAVPYRDVFDHKPPLIFFFNYFGGLLGPWGLWLIDTLLVMTASLFFFRLCQRFRLAWPWLLPLLFNLLLRNYLVCLGLGMTRAYTAIFMLLFFCFLFNGSGYKYFWLGLLTAAIFFMQQDQLIPLLPFCVYALFSDFSPKPGATQSPTSGTTQSPNSGHVNIARNLLLGLAGLLTLSAPILLYFGLHHALSYFWECAFQFNFSWYTEKIPFIIHFRSTKEALENSGLQLPLILALVAGITAVALKSTNKLLIGSSLLALVLSFIPEYLSGKLIVGHAFYYYFLPLSAIIPILIFTVWAYTKEDFLLGRKSQGFYGILLCFIPLYNALQHGTHLNTTAYDSLRTAPEYRWLQPQKLTDYQLFVFGNDNWVYLYNELDILSPSRWIYQHFWTWYPAWDADQQQMHGIIDDLQRHQTKYILNDLHEFPWKNLQARDTWLSFLDKYYRPIATPHSPYTTFWERK